MSFRVKIKERGLPNGRISLWALTAVVKSLQVALRAEASAIGARQPKQKGRLAKLARESIGMSLVAIEEGSGVAVWESETSSLIDVPRQVFEEYIIEANRPASTQDEANVAIQRALLQLEVLFKADSPVESVEFIDDNGKTGVVTSRTVDRIRTAIGEQITGEEQVTIPSVSGRLLELNLSTGTFEVHGIEEEKVTVHFDDLMKPIVLDAVDQFVTASIAIGEYGQKELVSMETLDDIPPSRFHETRTLAQIIAEQGLKPLTDFESMALEDVEPVSTEEFSEFIRDVRRGEAS